MIVKSDRTFHLSVDRAQQFLAENVSQDAADEHSHKQQEYDYEVLKKKMDFVNRPSRADILYLNKLQRLDQLRKYNKISTFNQFEISFPSTGIKFVVQSPNDVNAGN